MAVQVMAAQVVPWAVSVGLLAALVEPEATVAVTEEPMAARAETVATATLAAAAERMGAMAAARRT